MKKSLTIENKIVYLETVIKYIDGVLKSILEVGISKITIQWKSFEGRNDVMIEFDYDLDYKNLDFKPNDTRYRIGRGEQGVLLVRPYTDDICIYWKFRTPKIAEKSSRQIYHMYLHYKKEEDFVGMDMCRKFLEMGFTIKKIYQIIETEKSMISLEM